MTDQSPSEAWVEAANCLATVAHQLSSAIHEANNLLQVIAGSAEMIQCTPGLSAEVVKRTETISEHAHRVSLLLSSTRVSPAALTATGFRFQYPDLESALRHLLGS